MKKKTNNPNFEYEISCDQMCGRGHYTMKGVVKVVTPEEFILWKAKQKTNYAIAFPDKASDAQPSKDSAKVVASAALNTSIVAKASAKNN